MYCKHCGAQVDDDSRFCPSCGKGLFAEVTQQSQQPQPYQPRQTQQAAKSNSDDGIKGFLLACWNGEKSLVFTYWVILFGLNIILSLIGESEALALWVASLNPVLILFFLIAVVAIVVFQCVSVWRSAGNYTGWAGWKILARICVGLNIVTNALQFLVEFVNAL